MPFYEFECTACKFYVEVLQKISDAPLKKCPSCKKQTMKRLISAPVFRLKGEGWYETDFKSDKEDKRNLAGEDAEPAKEEAKPEATKDDKSADKPAEKPAAEKADKKAGKGKKPAAKPARKAPPQKKAAKKAAKKPAKGK
jgi:putative FmdB family regulatory protein